MRANKTSLMKNRAANVYIDVMSILTFKFNASTNLFAFKCPFMAAASY